jgi:hypothetical protein
MVFRSRRRAELQAMTDRTDRLERALQEQLDALARVEESVIDSVATTRQEVARREADLAQVLALVSDLCGQAMDIIEASREEHDVFLGSLAQVIRPVIAASAPTNGATSPGATVLGGVVVTATEHVDLIEIEARECAADPAPTDDPALDSLELPFR